MSSTSPENDPVGPVRWGVLGTGRVADDFVRGLRRVAGATLTAVGSRSSGRAAAFAAAHGGSRAHASYEALVSDAEVDAVYVATPHARHRDDSLLAIHAGKAVLCEKPLATNLTEAEEIVAAARARGVFLMEAMWMRFIPAVREAISQVHHRAIGTPRMLHAEFGVPEPESAGGRLWDPALGGGALLDRGVYPLHLAIALFGEPEQVVSEAWVRPSGVDEHSSALLLFPGGEIATIGCSLSAYVSNEAVIAGSAGRLRIQEPFCRPDRITLHAAPPARGPEFITSTSSPKQRIVQALKAVSTVRRVFGALRAATGSRFIPYHGNGYGHEAEEVGRCLAAGRTESRILPLEDSLRVMRTVDRIRAAWRPD